MSRKIEVEVVGDTKSLERAFKRAGDSGKSLETRLISVGKKAAIAVGALGTAAAVTGFKMVKMAGDAEEVRSKFRVTFQQEMPRMVKQLDAFAKSTGASRYELRQQAADLGALLVPLIGSRRAAGDLSVGFTKLATDLSSFNNVPVGEALQAIRAGLVGEAEPLRRFGVLLNEAAVKAEAYRSGIAKAGAVLTEQQKVQARANLIMQQTKLAQGDATRTADSFTNQMRKLQNQVTDTATALGTKLLPFATLVVTKLNEWGPALAQKVQPQLDRLSGWATTHSQEFKDLFANMKTGALEAAAAIGRIGVGADKTAKVMGGWDTAFTMILSGLLATQFAKVGKSISGAGGMLPLLTKLKGLGPTIAIAVTVDLIINEEHRKKLSRLADLIARKVGLDDPQWIPILGLFSEGKLSKRGSAGGAPATTTPSGTVADPRGGVGGGSTGALSGAGSVTVNPRTLPAGQGAQPIKPHVITFVKRIAGIFGSPLTIWDNSTHNQFVAGTNNKTESDHWTGNAADIPMSGSSLTRLGQAALIAAGASPSVAYQQTGGAYHVNGVNILFNTNIGGNHFNHLHVGLKSLPSETTAGGNKTVSPGTKAAAAGGAGGGATGAGGAASAAAPPLIPAGLRLALARAEGTKNLGDDLTALRAMVAYLQKLIPKTKDIEKRIEITEALNGLRERIAEIGKTKKKADISDAIDYEALKKKLRDKFREGLEESRRTIFAAKESFGQAFSALTDKLLSVFDAKTDQMIANLRTKVEGFDFTIGAGEETPSETALRLRRQAAADAQLQKNLAEATTPEERQRALDALEEDRLEKAARAEREAADKSLATAAQAIRDERELKRIGFQNALADLQASWAKTNATTAQRTADLQKLMATFDLPFNEVGALLGASFANGFLDSLQIVFDRLTELAAALNKVTPAQAAEAVILAGGSALAARSAALNAKYGLGSLPSFQTGGVVPGFGPQLAVVHGGETVLPRGAGTLVNHVHVYLDNREIFSEVQKTSARKSSRGDVASAFS